MKKTILWAIANLMFGFAILATSCQSNDPSMSASETVTAADESQAADLSNEVIATTDQYTPSFTGSSSMKVQSDVSTTVSDSVLVTVDKPDAASYPKTVTIDFGTNGFTGKRGNVLKGKIIITISNKMTIAESSRTITFDNFSVNDNAIKGKKVVTYKGDATWTVSASDTITKVDGSVVIWNSERTRTRISDNQTPAIFWDDSFAITGTSTGVNAKGVAYTMTIDSAFPLTTDGAYPHFTTGKVSIVTDEKTALVDYGDGTKDDIATITVDEKTKTFSLTHPHLKNRHR